MCSEGAVTGTLVAGIVPIVPTVPRASRPSPWRTLRLQVRVKPESNGCKGTAAVPGLVRSREVFGDYLTAMGPWKTPEPLDGWQMNLDSWGIFGNVRLNREASLRRFPASLRSARSGSVSRSHVRELTRTECVALRSVATGFASLRCHGLPDVGSLSRAPTRVRAQLPRLGAASYHNRPGGSPKLPRTIPRGGFDEPQRARFV